MDSRRNVHSPVRCVKVCEHRYMQKCMARQDASYKWHVQCILVVHTNIAFSGDSVGVECCMLEQLCVCLCSSTAVLACHERAD
eukprot:scaffold123129_cov21-Tisochrysis_lutea.AAC.8